MRHLLYIVFTILVAAAAVSCSTKKNTGLTRAVQSFKARYNTYYNGHVAFIEGVDAQEEGNKDNYTEVIPLYMTANKSTTKLGSSSFDRTVEKCQKTIKQHSITKRPEWKSNKPKKPKDKIWLSQKEYNPFLYKAWFLMGEAQFRSGQYMEAASTYAYIQRLYFSKPNIVARARLLEARSYAELEWFYDAEDQLNRATRDSFPKQYEGLKSYIMADMETRQRKYSEAIPHIKAALKTEKSSLQRTRMHFLLGQLYHKIGDEQSAYKAFQKVISKNPPYELEFNARIQQTETMSKSRSKQMIRKLQAMTKNSKNKDYLDQVYYAIGNIYLSKGDTTRAIYAYKAGVDQSTRNGIEKGVVELRLGQLYWDKEEFVKAQKCYTDVLGLLDKERDDYDEIDKRSKILDNLLPHASAIELQDSLQALAKMDSVQRMKQINILIAEAKRLEKENAIKAMEASERQNNGGNNGTGGNGRANPNANRRGGTQEATWYFYNPTAVASGKTTFQSKWGKRPLEDDWRRSNKTVLNDIGGDEDEAVADSISSDSTFTDSGMADGGKSEEELSKEEEYKNDPHRPEYYLKDIPLTEEQMEASNAALVDGLYNAGIIYKDEMENLPLAERTFQRILIDFPDYEHVDETYYNLYQLYSREGKADDAEAYKGKLLAEYPDNEHGKKIADPNFAYKARYGKAVEDSLYAQSYEAFQRGDYGVVLSNERYTAREYPEGANRPRFMFLSAMSKLEQGNKDSFMSDMKAIVEKYPQSTVSELAGLYVKGLKEGRLLASGKMDAGSLWERSMAAAFDEDSLSADTSFTAEKICDYVFAIAYPNDSIDENQLLYETARYNFTNFNVRNFDISMVRGSGISMLQVRTFVSQEEAYIYMHRLLNDKDMATKLEGLKCFIISESNLKLLMRGRSFADYFKFYDENFGRIKGLDMDNSTLDEPEELPEQQYEGEEEEYEEEEEGNYIF